MARKHTLQTRMDFMGLDAQTCEHLRAAEADILAALPAALDGFYAQLKQTPETARFFSDDGHVASAKNRQSTHWQEIARGHFNGDFVARVTRVGEVHARIGLEPSWYIGGYGRIVEAVIQHVLQARWPKSRFGAVMPGAPERAAEIGAIVKAALLDMDYAITVYLEASEAARLKSEEAVQAIAAEQARARDLIVNQVTDAMAALAQGDLGYRMSDAVPAEYAQVPQQFNQAMQRLEDMIGTIQQTSQQLAASSATIREGARNLFDRTEQQATALEETAATSEELAATVKSAATSSSESVTLANEAAKLAHSGGTIVSEAVEAMGRIESESKKISEIISVIDGIAFQTNLLALNAGVEAARAGDAGRGFAVVATEVRALAKRSAEAARDITALISASAEHVTTGVRLVREAGGALQDIVAASGRVSQRVSQISEASQEQAIGIEEMARTVSQMDEITQQNATLAEESAQSAQTLNDQISRLEALIARFKISGRGQSMASEAAHPVHDQLRHVRQSFA